MTICRTRTHTLQLILRICWMLMLLMVKSRIIHTNKLTSNVMLSPHVRIFSRKLMLFNMDVSVCLCASVPALMSVYFCVCWCAFVYFWHLMRFSSNIKCKHFISVSSSMRCWPNGSVEKKPLIEKHRQSSPFDLPRS